MKIRKTFAALFGTVCSIVFVLLATVLVAAACSEKVTLRFETGSGTHIASVEGEVGGEYEKPQDPHLDGYYFDGWFLDPSFSGEPQILPDVMPQESTTYYAKYEKYPILTLCTDAGIELMQLEVKPGTDLSTRLKGIAPEKEGLIFGGWALDGEVLDNNAVMGAEDMTLTARYKASYRVDVYLQNADEPEHYEIDPQLSFTAADWVGTELVAQIRTPAHFRYEAERSSSGGVLQAGSNTFGLYFSREEFTVTLDPAFPGGGGVQTQIPTRYGAHLTLERPDGGEGYSFLGWRDAGGDHREDEVLTLTGALSLKGIWAVSYPNALGEGTLYAEVGEEPVRRAVYEIGKERYTGQFDEVRQTFSAGPYGGKLEPHGGFLPDDSGTYREGDLTGNMRTETGRLTLDFFGGTARYECGETSLDGTYAPLYDDAAQRYTGEYAFAGAFNFRLYDAIFLREGKERGRYARYDLAAGELQKGVLFLDGYGNAVLSSEKTLTGRYFRGDADWNFVTDEGETLRFLLGGRSWSDGEEVAVEDAFLLWEESLSGSYIAAGDSLTLDGYGLCAVLREAGTARTAAFVRERDVVTLFFDPVLRFTLHGETFLHTSEEEGCYEGELGGLYLDGAGGAVLDDGVRTDRGEYVPDGEGYNYEGGIRFLFRLREEGYDVYHAENAGTYENYFYETALTLDGFGGGKCYLTAGDGFDVRLLYKDDKLILLASDAFHSPRKTAAFRVDAEGFIAEVPSIEAGLFPVYEGGEPTGEMLLLDGMGKAQLLGSDVGEYVYSHTKRETVCNFGGNVQTFRLGEKNGVYCCERALCAGEYSGEGGTLSLDGYGGAVFAAGERVPYLVKYGAVELDLGAELLRFTLSGDSYTLVRFRRYTDPLGSGTLYLGQDSISAILRCGEEYYGSYGLDTFLSEGKSISFRLKGDEFYVFDAAQAGTFTTAEGDVLKLDGCGFGTLTRGGTVSEGNAFLIGDRILFTAEGVSLGYRLEGGNIYPLGEECGIYRPEGMGAALFLRGDGTLIFWENGVSAAGEYVMLRDDVYEVSVRGDTFCLRISRENRFWARWEETLAAFEGNYSYGDGILFVDGCSIKLKSDAETSYRFLCACEGGFLARDMQTGKCFRFRFGAGVEISSADPHFFVLEI